MSIFYLKTPNVHSTIYVLGLLFVGANVGTRTPGAQEHQDIREEVLDPAPQHFLYTPAIFTYVYCTYVHST